MHIFAERYKRNKKKPAGGILRLRVAFYWESVSTHSSIFSS